jgi:hypothetical protein
MVLLLYHISSSGPLRKFAPASLASWILWRILLRFPSKSRAHWFRVQTAMVTLHPMVLKYKHHKTRKKRNLFEGLSVVKELMAVNALIHTQYVILCTINKEHNLIL